MKLTTNLIILAAWVLLSLPLLSYVSEQRSSEEIPEEAQGRRIQTLQQAKDELKQIQEGRKETERAGDILTAPDPKQAEIRLGPESPKDWPVE